MYIIFNDKNHTFFRWRLLCYTIISLIMIISDIKLHIFIKIQNYINYPSLFLYYLTEVSNQWIKSITYSLNSNRQLILENNALKKELFIINNESLLIEYYKQENRKLRELLSAPILNQEKKILAQVIAKKINIYTAQITINRGTNHDVHIGQAVVNEQGIIGQIVTTSKRTSQVLLICDISHALSVQVLRNNTRMILKGDGYNNYLKLTNISSVNNIKVGDILITSGLDGQFPPGYPVAVVNSINIDFKSGFSTIQASSIAKLHSLSYVLLLTNTKNNTKQPLSKNTTYKIFKKRLNSIQQNNKYYFFS